MLLKIFNMYLILLKPILVGDTFLLYLSIGRKIKLCFHYLLITSKKSCKCRSNIFLWKFYPFLKEKKTSKPKYAATDSG